MQEKKGNFLFLKTLNKILQLWWNPYCMYFYLFHIQGELLQLIWILSKCHNDEQYRKTNKEEDRKLQLFVAMYIFEKNHEYFPEDCYMNLIK